MTCIVIPPMSPRGEGFYQPAPRMVGPAQDPEIRDADMVNLPIPGTDESVLVMFSRVPSPGREARNFGVEALIGIPAHGPAVVTSGDMEHMSEAAIGHVLRTATTDMES